MKGWFNMNLSDIIALAKQGYKPQDIKELIALADESADSEDAGGGAGSEDAGAGSEDAGGGAGKSEMEQLVDQLRQQNKNLQDALKRMDLSKNVKTESASDILKETLTSIF